MYYTGNCNPPLTVENALPIAQNKIVLFPNPTSNAVQIKNLLGKDISTLQVLSMDGRLQKVFNHVGREIFIGDLPQGLYQVRCITDDTQVSIVPYSYWE